MIPFDTFTLTAVASEMRRLALGARVQKIHQPLPGEIVLSLFGKAGAQRLLLSADPQSARAHLSAIRRDNPQTPPGFCQVCRKYLEGALLEDIVVPRFDRLLRLEFRAYDGEQISLIAELMGRNANVILVSGTGTVRGMIRPTPAGAKRPLRPGAPYVDPPGYGDRTDPLALSAEELRDRFESALPDAIDAIDARKWLLTDMSGIAPFAADEILARAGAPERVPEALGALMDDIRADRFEPHSIGDPDGSTIGVWAFAPLSVPASLRFPRASISEALETFTVTRLQESSADQERAEVKRTIAREIAFRRRELTAAEATLDEAARAETRERHANLLLAHMAAIPRGADMVTVTDLYDPDGAQVAITLDPKRSPAENARTLFDRARRARDAADYAEGKIADLHADLEALTELERTLEALPETESLEEVRRELAEVVGEARAQTAAKPQRAPKEKPFGGHRIRTFTVDGYDLLIGETAEANDYLTTRVASPNDLWLHVRAAAGAHGVIRTAQRPGAVPDTVQRRAAEIVAARSGTAVKHAGVVAVDIVERRYVRKPRGARPGFVTYSRERTLDVTPRA